MPGNTYTCTCTRFCKGYKTGLSRATYYRHAPFRPPEFSASFQNFLQDSSVRDPQAGTSSNLAVDEHEASQDSDETFDNGDNMTVVRHDHDVEMDLYDPAFHFSTGASDISAKESQAGVTGDNEDHGETDHGETDDLADPGSQYMERLQNATVGDGGDQNSHFNDSLSDNGEGEGSEGHENGEGEEEGMDIDEHFQETSDISDIETAWSSYIDKLSGLAKLDSMKTAMAFIQALRTASFDDEWTSLDPDTLDRLRNPPTVMPININDNPSWRLGLDLYLSVTNAAQETYTSVRKAILRRYPNDEVPSYDQMKRYVAELSGVYSMEDDMCINSCLAFTCPYKDLQTCPECNEPRFDPLNKKPRQQLHTIPIGPQLQALRKGQNSQDMDYRWAVTEQILKDMEIHDGNILVIKDLFYGQDYIDLVDQGRINKDDIVLMFSIDGAQLYASKASDCWIYIWVIFEYSPGTRYKKKRVLPGGFIPGPNKPKNSDSFLFPGLHHLAALQREGLCMLDFTTGTMTTSHPFLVLATADGPGMTYLNGLVGHHGKNGCRLFCSVPGRHKAGGSHYYPALLKPNNFSVIGSDHPDIDIYKLPSTESKVYEEKLLFVVGSPNETQYKKRRLETGISKPSIFLGLNPQYRLDIPGCFPSDIMHLAALNIPDLLINLWRGSLDCDKNDDRGTWDWAVLQGRTWEIHGKEVAACTPYLPGSFDRPPRNPAEKISSGYKAWEFLMYIYGFGPALFYGVLPEKYWMNFCKLVFGMRIILEHEISSEDLRKAHQALLEFCHEFEVLYVQRRPERIHFVRQSIHAITHLAPEAFRIGPAGCYSQWTMERTIGNLVEEIRQHSNPYANLSQRGLQRSQNNALKSMFPDLDEEKNTMPRGACDLGDGYVLLRAMDKAFYNLSNVYSNGLRSFLWATYKMSLPEEASISIKRWARLQLPTGQVARSSWKECLKPLEKVRMSRNVKINKPDGHPVFAEVHFYFQFPITADGESESKNETFAFVSEYSPPHPDIFEKSRSTFWWCTPTRSISVVKVKHISSVVAMIPRPLQGHGIQESQSFLCEMPGLHVACMSGAVDLEVVQEE